MQSRAICPVWALICLIVCVPVAVADVQINHAERVTIPMDTHSVQPGKYAGPASVIFDALGRRFDLELQSNERLLSRLPAAQRAEIDGRLEVYRGRLAGVSQSWVRLTRAGNEYYGLIWDGNEFYSIAPLERVRALLAAPTAAKGNGDTLVYRAADTVIDLGPEFCKAVDRPGAVSAMNGAQAFDSVLSELRASPAVTAERALEIEVSLIADYEFFNRHIDAEGALLARFNIVDGIFSEQLGLRITAARLAVFTTSADPFTTTDAGDLLDQLAGYRESHAALTAFGLTHLVTGRELDGRTVGMGYIDGVCDPFAGTSLSSDMTFDVSLSALIAAHELGHNFGAEHDDEPGSVCAATPGGYLMAPALNGSSTFSQCSIDTMTPIIEAAPCIFPATVVDVAVAAAESAVSTPARQPFEIGFDFESAGNTTTASIQLRVDELGPLTFQNATLAGGTCEIAGYFVRCEHGPMAAGDSRRLTLTMLAAYAETASVTARIVSGDDDPSNDAARVDITIVPQVDVSIAVAAAPGSGMVGEVLAATFDAAVAGSEVADDVIVDLWFTGGDLLSVSAGNCTLEQQRASCALGTLSAGSLLPITVTFSSSYAGSFSINAQVRATHDDLRGNELADHAVVMMPTIDMQLTTGESYLQADVDAPLTVGFELASIGPLPVVDAVLDVAIAAGGEILELRAEGATCAAVVAPTEWRCGFDPIGPGVSRHIDVTVRGHRLGGLSLTALASAPGDQNPGNTYQGLLIDILQPTDLTVSTSGMVYAYDGLRFAIQVYVSAIGRLATTDAAVAIALPDAVSATSVSTTQGNCAIADGTVNCTLGTIEPNTFAQIDLELDAPEPGTYYGTATVSSASDRDASNDQVTIGFTIRPATDISISMSSLPVNVVGKSFDVPVQLQASTQPIESATFRVQSNSGNLEILSASTTAGTCAVAAGVVDCAIDPLPARGAATIALRVTGRIAGVYWLYAEASTPGDVDNANNFAQVSAEIENEPPPEADRGSSGGGGRLDAQWLLLALSILYARTAGGRRSVRRRIR